jgi:hypothetical protein
MSENRVGSPVPIKVDIKGARKAFKVIVPKSGQPMLVGDDWVYDTKFTPGQAFRANQTFVQELSSLSETLAIRLTYDLNDEEDLQESLNLDETTSRLILDTLRKVGAGLRSELSSDLVNAFHVLGFLRDGVQEEPALTFQEITEAPILWEMMYEYEGDQLEYPDWKRFWGFRIPITHWKDKTRTGEIWLKQGLFSATSENLRFASLEAKLLGQQLKQMKLGQTYSSLEEVFQKRVHKELLNKMQDNSNMVNAWWDECKASSKKSNIWLKRFLNQLTENVTKREGEAEIWKRAVLAHIFKESGFPYDLVHFACHCEPSEKSEFLSRLEMMVAGEKVTFDVSLLATYFCRKEKWNEEEPGPLVFLNACGSGQQSSFYDPPGFPDKWVRYQGALAVIATICPVPDYFAHAFAMKFYEILFKAIKASKEKGADPVLVRNCHLAEALLATRRYFMEKFNNPLGLAYILFATNGAHVQADLVEASS